MGKTTYPKVDRPPKKFTKKSLHGRTRLMVTSYKDLRRFQNFIINVFGWDMIEMPEAASGIPAGDPNPALLVATGPAQYDYEGVTPGHMNLCARPAYEGHLEKIGPWTEIEMDAPLEETIKKMTDHGGKRVLLCKTPRRQQTELGDTRGNRRPCGKSPLSLEMSFFENMGRA